jgi:predicted CoA-binding protein
MSVENILKSCRVVAMVGASPNPDRPSYRVFNYLTEHGFNVIPVNPAVAEVCGKKSYASLAAIPDKVDVVDIFRRSEDVPAIVDEAIKIGAKAVWMQEGIVNEEAARKATDAGLEVVMDKCMFKEHRRLTNG